MGNTSRLNIVLVCTALLFLAGCGYTGSGTAHDTIYQAQTDGVIWQTQDVWLTNDHPSERSSAIYCVELDNPGLFKEIQAAVKDHKQCDIKYHNEMLVAPWRCADSTIIDGVDCK